MKCNHCNSEVADGTNFCPYCGKPIGVPQSLKCPLCNLDVPEGTKFCPNCGSPIGTPKPITCRKCGTELQEGDKFCYKCGEAANNETCHQSGYNQSDRQDVSNRAVSKAEGIIQQSKKYINEKVQPQLDEKINEFKNVDWEDKKKESVSLIKEFFSNVGKLRMATIIIAIIAVLWFFIFNHGFSAKWTWWLFALAFVISAFYKVEAKDKADALKKARWSFGFAIFLGLIFLLHSQSSESGVFGGTDEPSYNVSDIEASISFNTEQDVRTYLCNHRFKSSDGYTLSFSRNAYEVSINGRVLTSTTDVYVSSTTSASIRTHGPYGNTTFRLSVSGGDGVITDSNDGESYYSR